MHRGDPCTIDQAFATAADGDTIAVGAGAYVAASPRALDDGGRDLHLEGSGRPALVNTTLTLTGAESTVQDLYVIRNTGNALTLANGAQADRVFTKTGGGNGCVLQGPSGLRDSLCVASEAGVRAEGLGGQTIRHATASGALGRRFATTTAAVAVENSILVGAIQDAYFESGVTNAFKDNFSSDCFQADGAIATSRFVLAGADQPEQDTTGGAVSRDLTGLTPGTTYEYELRVQAAGGTVDCAPKSFTTVAAPSPSPSPKPSVTATASPSPNPTAAPSTACDDARAKLAKAKRAARRTKKAVKQAKAAKRKRAARKAAKRARARVKKARAAVRAAC